MKADFHSVGLSWAVFTNVGNVRTLNEDSVLADAPVFVVADGMGGHSSGEVASGLVVDRFGDLVGRDPLPAEEVADLLHRVNHTIRAASDMNDARSMGTTAVGLILSRAGSGLSWLVFNVGDSRAYVWARGALSQVSIDHSYVQELVAAGQLTPEEARHHREKNVITRALGVSDVVQPDYWLRPLVAGERYLLCSDGLTGEVDDDVIGAVLDSAGTTDEAVHRLGQLALDNGGHDNVTMIVIDVVTVPVDGEESTETRPGTGGAVRLAVDGDEIVGAGAVGTMLIDRVPRAGQGEDTDVQGDRFASNPDGAMIARVPVNSDQERTEPIEARGVADRGVDGEVSGLITSVPIDLDGGEEEE